MKILTYGASSSRNSVNKKLATYATSLVEGADVELIDLNDFEMPIYSMDREVEGGIPQQAHDFMAKIEAADALVISLAEHNGSYTAAYKNLFDWSSRINAKVYQDTKVIFLGTSPGPGGAGSVMRTALGAAPFNGADVVGSLSIPVYGQNLDTDTGAVTNPDLDAELHDLMGKLSA